MKQGVWRFNRFYRYDFASTQVLIGLASRYYGVAVSAHVLSYTPTSVSQLLSQLGKAFFIDPFTFVFARNLRNISRNGRVRRSFRKLAEDYGPPFSECLMNNTQLMPARFRDQAGNVDDTIITTMCKAVLDFQRNKCGTPTAFPRYAKLLKKGIVLQPLSPSFLVPPYFFAERHGGDWYSISLRSAQIAKTLKGNHDLYPVICISRDMLWDPVQISSTIRDYSGFDGYIVWINDFDETTATDVELMAIKSLVSTLAAYGKPVYSLYGGYLCDLLTKFGLKGYSSGICYGEKRSVDAVGGGAGNRYYVNAAHLKVSEDLANSFFAQSTANLRHMCSCSACTTIRQNIPTNANPVDYADRFFTQMDFLDYRRHFVNAKYQEASSLKGMSVAQILNSLDSDIEAIVGIDGFPGHPPELRPQHLRIWRTLFS